MEQQNQQASALARAVKVSGSQVAFAKIAGRSQPMVSLWLKKGMPLPAECVIQVEAATGISRHELRPDLYPLDQSPPPAPQSAEQPPARPKQDAISCPNEDEAAGGSSSSDPLEGMAA